MIVTLDAKRPSRRCARRWRTAPSEDASNGVWSRFPVALEFFATDRMRFIPMSLSPTDSTVPQSNTRDAVHFSANGPLHTIVGVGRVPEYQIRPRSSRLLQVS